MKADQQKPDAPQQQNSRRAQQADYQRSSLIEDSFQMARQEGPGRAAKAANALKHVKLNPQSTNSNKLTDA